MQVIRIQRASTRAFTLIELIAVIVVLAIISGIAIPKYFDYAAKARESATKGALGGVRSGIANYYANSALSGTATFPTLTQIQTVGTVMQERIPPNPYNNSAIVLTATWDAISPPVAGTGGWNYDPATGRFWANSNTVGENEW